MRMQEHDEGEILCFVRARTRSLTHISASYNFLLYASVTVEIG